MVEGMCCDKIFSSLLEVKKSQFLSYLLPYELFKETMIRLKEFISIILYLGHFLQTVFDILLYRISAYIGDYRRQLQWP